MIMVTEVTDLFKITPWKVINDLETDRRSRGDRCTSLGKVTVRTANQILEVTKVTDRFKITPYQLRSDLETIGHSVTTRSKGDRSDRSPMFTPSPGRGRVPPYPHEGVKGWNKEVRSLGHFGHRHERTSQPRQSTSSLFASASRFLALGWNCE